MCLSRPEMYSLGTRSRLKRPNPHLGSAGTLLTLPGMLLGKPRNSASSTFLLAACDARTTFDQLVVASDRLSLQRSKAAYVFTWVANMLDNSWPRRTTSPRASTKSLAKMTTLSASALAACDLVLLPLKGTVPEKGACKFKTKRDEKSVQEKQKVDEGRRLTINFLI